MTDQELLRRASRTYLSENGFNPYQYAFEVSHRAGELQSLWDAQVPANENDEPAKIEVCVAGRIMTRRIMGKASFFNLRDHTNDIQVYLRRDDLPEGFYNDIFKKHIDLGDIVGVKGYLFVTQTGELSIHATSFELLTKALRPLPVVKETEEQSFGGLADKELRYRMRYVDLMTHADVREVFQKRAQLISTMRQFLDERGYLEVETPVLQPLYGGAAARPFTTHHNALDMELYMRISDELYLKRLMVGGFDGVYEISKDFRNEGLSRFHNPEFTMMELYVAYKDYAWMMDLVEEMIEKIALKLHGTTEVQVGENTISFKRPWKRIPLFQAIEEETGHNLAGKSKEELLAIAKSLSVEVDKTMGVGKIIDEIFGTHVEPKLIQPTFLTDYPVELSPLAKKHRSQEGLVERFEAMCNGKEIANAFSELNDPLDQRERFEAQVALKADGDDETMPIDEDYIRALEFGMPPTAGVGIGIDRLTMIMTNQESIRDVILFPLLRPE